MKPFPLLFGLILFLVACQPSPLSQKLDKAESMMENHPDSALKILENIDTDSIDSSKEIKARYALLKSMALDKNYIDTTDLSILLPALKWFTAHGRPDDKLRTYYYQGCIYQNRNRLDSALYWFTKAKNVSGITDSLTYARTLVAQSMILRKEYRYKEYRDLNYTTARLFRKAGNFRSELNCLRRIMEGSIFIKDSLSIDSIWEIVKSHPLYTSEEEQEWITFHLKYLQTFNKTDALKTLSDSLLSKRPFQDQAIYIDLADAELSFEQPQLALELLEEVKDEFEKNKFQFLLVRCKALAATGNYKEAYSSLAEYLSKYQERQINIRTAHAIMPDQKFEIEKKGADKVEEREKQILILAVVGLSLIIIILTISYNYRLKKEKLKNAELENQVLSHDNENLILEKETLSKELNLENERLQTLLNVSIKRDSQLQEIARKQLSILNGFLAAEISAKESKKNRYEKILKDLVKNREKLQETLYHSFSLSHPEFVRTIESMGLSKVEKEMVYLYAIGLQGQEIGLFLQTSKHYHISSSIRTKFGMNATDTNLGIRIREMLNIERINEKTSTE